MSMPHSTCNDVWRTLQQYKWLIAFPVLLASSCNREKSSARADCTITAGITFAGTVTDPTGVSQRTAMSITAVSAGAPPQTVVFNGMVNATGTWIVDSAQAFNTNGKVRLVTPANDTLALACAAGKRSLTCENVSRSRCLLTEVAP